MHVLPVIPWVLGFPPPTPKHAGRPLVGAASNEFSLGDNKIIFKIKMVNSLLT